MRINGLSSGMQPNAAMGSPMGTSMVDEIMAVDSSQVTAAKGRRDQVLAKKKEFGNLDALLTKLQSTADQMKAPSAFQKFSVDSSAPDILVGEITGPVRVGSYDLEINSLARSEKSLSFGFPDKDKTPVGFGFMRVFSGDEGHDVVIEPGETLRDVASKINENVSGVRASVINTGTTEDPFKLLVSSVDSGMEARIEIDPDTSFLEFKKQVQGQDLSAKFSGIDVRRPSNKLDELVDGLNLKALKAAPGQEVSINVRHDLDKTASSINEFVAQYNEIQQFSKRQSSASEGVVGASALSGESSLRQVNRTLQGAVAAVPLADIGITTNPKTGELRLDEAKLKDALSKDYDGVMKIFASTEAGPGLASRLSDAIKGMKDKSSGIIGARMKGIDQRIKQQDEDIQKKEERLGQRRLQLEKSLGNLDAKVATMQGQAQFLKDRLQPSATQ